MNHPVVPGPGRAGRAAARLAVLAALILPLGCAGAASQRGLADLSKRIAVLEERNAELEKATLKNAQAGESTRARVEVIGRFLGNAAPGWEKVAAEEPAPPPREPDPGAVYAVPVDGDAYEGPEAAPVTIVVAFDFACPYCRKLVDTMADIQHRYGRNVRVVYKHFIVHRETATAPALAACAAGRQGKFSQMAHLLWTRGFDAGGYSPELLDTFVKELKLDRARYDADVDSCLELLAVDQDILNRLGVNGTPATYVNGRFLSGAQEIGVFTTLIDAELYRAEERIRAGTRVEDYYGKYVLAVGQHEP